MAHFVLAVSWLYKPNEVSSILRQSNALCSSLASVPSEIFFSLHYIVQDPFYLTSPDALRSLFPSCVHIHYFNIAGLSRSRNYALKSISCDYIHFLDSDIFILDPLDYVNACMDIFVGRAAIACFSPSVQHQYSNFSLMPRVLMLLEHLRFMPYAVYCSVVYWYCFFSVPSYSYIINVEAIRSTGVLFWEDLGLGAPFPQSEEACFMANTVKSLHVPCPRLISCFPLNFSSYSHTNVSVSSIESKGILFARTHPLLGPFFLLLLSISIALKNPHLANPRGIARILLALFQGFWYGLFSHPRFPFARAADSF